MTDAEFEVLEARAYKSQGQMEEAAVCRRIAQELEEAT